MNELEVYLDRRRPGGAGLPHASWSPSRTIPYVKALVAAGPHHRLRAHVHRTRSTTCSRRSPTSKVPSPNFEDGVRNQRVLAAMEKAAATKRWVTVNVTLAGERACMRSEPAHEDWCVFTVLFGNKPFEETLDYVEELGLEAVEIGTGAYPGNAHCKPGELLEQRREAEGVQGGDRGRGLVISALSCHGNPLHPRREARARASRRVFKQTVELAGKLGVKQVITFSGCPGGDPKATQPNWIMSPVAARVSRRCSSGSGRSGSCRTGRRRRSCCKRPACASRSRCTRTSSPTTPRRCCGCATSRRGTIGCNFDPSHMFWQQVDVRRRRSARSATRIYHVHAKDCRIDRANTARERRARREEVHATSSSARGSSARSATATTRSSGGTSSATCAWSATTTCSASSTKTA